MRIHFQNALVYTGEGWADSFTVEGDRLIWVGRREECPFSDGQTIDLGGKFVCAGFNDSHMHLLSLGNTLNQAELSSHTQSLEGMLEYLRAYIRQNDLKPGAWVFDRGFNEDNFSDLCRFPDRRDLDRVSTVHPIAITRTCGHICAVNSKALELMKIGATFPKIEGGEIGSYESGEPNGLFYENALEFVYAQESKLDDSALKAILKRACARLNRYGVTSCQSDDYETIPGIGYKRIMRLMQSMAESGELTVRVNEQAQFASLDALRAFVASGDHQRGDCRFKNGPLKMVGDGSLGAHTAYLTQAYRDQPDTRGIPIYTRAEFMEYCEFAHQNGMQLAIHVIGDGILDWVLDAYEAALEKYPRADHRHGLVHCQIVRKDQMARILKLGLHVYTQSIFLDYDTRIVHARVNDALAATSYPAKSLLRDGATLSNGSDAPVEEPVVLRGIECAVTRRSIGTQNAPYRPEEALSVREAIDSYTIGGAYASFEEKLKGKIKAGMLADFVVLEKNPFETEVDQLHNISVMETWLGGKCVYAKTAAIETTPIVR